MGRPPVERKQRQIAVALPPDIRTRLEEASADNWRTLSEEVRQRLEFSFQIAAIDAPTRSVQEAIANIARRLEADCEAPWYSSTVTRQAFVAALNTVAAQIASKRPPWSEAEATEHTPDRVGGADAIGDPETIGRLRALDECMSITSSLKLLNEVREISEKALRLRRADISNGETTDDKKTGTRRRRDRSKG